MCGTACPTTQARAALYLRVSTGRQATNDLSIPDQRRQLEAYCKAKGWEAAVEYVEPGNTATDDWRPLFQSMIEAALIKPPAFDVIVVHSFSRFFRDQFQFEFYVRKLAKNGVRLVSITQELGDEARKRVTQIMKPDTLQLGGLSRPIPGLVETDGRPLPASGREHVWTLARPPHDFRKGGRVQRDHLSPVLDRCQGKRIRPRSRSTSPQVRFRISGIG